MKINSPAIILYLVSSLLYLLAIYFDSEEFILFFKPMIASSMLFYYWQHSYKNINIGFVVILVLLFASGIFNTFDDEFALTYVLILNILAYSILLSFTFKKMIKVDIMLVDKYNLTYIIISFFLMFILFYVAIVVVFDTSEELYYLITLYSFILLLLGAFTTVKVIVEYSKSNVYLMIATFCFILCDLFYILYYYYLDFLFFRYISIISNIVSFYFLVNYFLEYNKKKIEESSIDF
jgi:hypothetical protein